MNYFLTKRLMEPQTSDAGAGGASDAGGDSGASSASVPSAPVAGRVETPDFGELANWDESLMPADDEVPAQPPAAAVTQQPPAAAPAASQAPSPAAQAPAAATAQPPSQPTQAAPAPQATPPAEPAQQPPASATAPATSTEPTTIEQHRERALPELAKLYSIPAEMVEELRVTPETALPKLAAQLHFEVVMSAYQAVMSQLPQMVSGFMGHQSTVEKANNDFFTAWPDLKDPTHTELVKGSIKAYKAANPKATTEQIIKGAGALAMIQLGKNPMIATATPIPQPAVPAAAPGRPAGVGASAAPFAPAGHAASAPKNDVEALVDAMFSGEVD